jgi:hypothetical protein
MANGFLRTESGLMQWTRGKTTSPESMGATKAQGGSWFMFLETKPQVRLWSELYIT